MKLLLKIQYDGKNYCGYQYQPKLPTVQGKLTECISAFFGFPCKITGCSRTDAGVHALGFCATVEPYENMGDFWCTVPEGKIHRALNPFLPADIAVVGDTRVDDSFHPRYSVISKEYLYIVKDSLCRDVFSENRAFRIPRRLTDEDISKMNLCAERLVGKHDFSAFMAQGSSVEDTVRNLMKLEVKRFDADTVHISVCADGFLYNMVRILTGTLLDVSAGKIELSEIESILLSGDRKKAGFTAPPEGLYLKEVNYGGTVNFKTL